MTKGARFAMLEVLLVALGVLGGAPHGNADVYVWRNAHGVTGYSYSKPDGVRDVRRLRMRRGWPPAMVLTRVGRKAAVRFACGFTHGAGDCGFAQQARAPDRVSLVQAVLDGAPGVELRTQPGDSHLYGSGAAERADLALSQADTGCHEGSEQVWEHSILFPDDYVAPPKGGWGVVFDFHHTGATGQANFHVDAMPDPIGLRLRGYGGTAVGSGEYQAVLGPVVRNAWYHFVYHVKWSSHEDGFFYAWVNGKQELAHRGPTLYRGMGCYLKLSNYHTAFGKPSSVIHARVIRHDIGGKDATGIAALSRR